MILSVRAIRPERTDVAMWIFIGAGGRGMMREKRAGAAPRVDRVRQFGFGRLVVSKTTNDAADAGVLRKRLVAAGVEQHPVRDAFRPRLRKPADRCVRDGQLTADRAVEIGVQLKHPDRRLQRACPLIEVGARHHHALLELFRRDFILLNRHENSRSFLPSISIPKIDPQP